ncbi:P12 [Buzura suppressaria nucleopolyhedrovirus]|uniref:p12 n=1 Tax=Buzura suppressaria nuclear polyhedrosis virus TaxID=74320 RepID=W5VSA7_NPVBS|nr:P12 [Buzura suppressaria nucleopolyhedrovirus]AHH82667.1 P12 [Buzura suppressaria nucleopolyhedrovirus]AKN91050.1 P12 [Buzura suppressaria nucleopolyhedrovirus]QYF10633.1 P12 [Buzura suppressaria nucleopolyhedrovirus]
MSSSGNLIDTASIRPQKRNKRFDPPPVDNSINPAVLINALNDSDNTVASVIMRDQSVNKVNSFKILSPGSAVAKQILKDIEDDTENIRLNTMRATNILRFLSNIYDDTLQIVV